MSMDPVTTGLASQHLIEFGFAMALAASAWRRHWGFVAFLALALLEAHENQRYPFHVWVRDALLGTPPTNTEKHLLQSTLIYSSMMVGLAALLILTPALIRASAGGRIMIGGAALVVALLAIELISEHKMDAVIYHLEGPFARVAIIYFIGAIAITCGALMTPRRKHPLESPSAPHGVSADA